MKELIEELKRLNRDNQIANAIIKEIEKEEE